MNASTNKTTEFRYNADGKLVELVVQNETTGNQTTKWVYGTTKAESGVASNELVRAKIYPDADDQGNPLANGADGVFDRVEYRYNALGEVTEMKDQNGTVHEYLYDALGRLAVDRVSALGTGVDGAVRAIARGYDPRGQLASVFSFADTAMTTMVNQVAYQYNGFGQVLADIQSHAGAVTTSTPRVSYEYEAGGNNTVRQTALIYPNGRRIQSFYGTASIDDLLDRVRELRDTDNSVLARYTKRGTNATVIVEYPEPTVELTYLKQGSEPDGDAGDQYTGLDRFNRIADIRWLKRAGATIADVERVQYGFDRASNRTWRKNLVAPPGFDEAYQYDGLYQLSDMRRGDLNINHTTIGAIPVWEESWNYDSAGNWKDYTTRVGGNDPTVQTRTHNKVNELTFIDGSNTKVGYDGAGNMTVMPKVGAPSTAQQNTWDAWNRLVKVMEGATTIVRYSYDGLTRRTLKMFADGTNRHGYFTSQWQLIEERLGMSMTPETHFVWGTRYLDDLILRDCEDVAPTRLYALHDQWHVTGVVDVAGTGMERYIYSAFGVATILTGTFGTRSNSSYSWETLYGAYHFDLETRMYCVRYRYLHPALGRWVSRDPLGEVGGLNLEAFVENRIPNSIDVDGRSGFPLLDPNFTVESNACTTTDPISKKTTIKKCHIVIFLGHNNTVPQGPIGNEDCSAGHVINCGGAGKYNPGRCEVPLKASGNYTPDMRETIDSQLASIYMKGAIDEAVKMAAQICRDKKKCCREIKIEVVNTAGVGIRLFWPSSPAKKYSPWEDASWHQTIKC